MGESVGAGARDKRERLERNSQRRRANAIGKVLRKRQNLTAHGMSLVTCLVRPCPASNQLML